jgi:hypothetical protein
MFKTLEPLKSRLTFYRMRAFEQEVSVGAKLWRAFDKTV